MNFFVGILINMGSFVSKVFESETLQATFLGAILAALFGVFTQKYINWSEQKRRIKKYARLLFNDISHIQNHIRSLRFWLEEYSKNPKINIFDYCNEWNFVTSSNWEEYLAEVTEKLPEVHIRKISDIYTLVCCIHTAILSKNLNELAKLTATFFEDEIERKYHLLNIPIFNITIEELRDDLLKLGIKGWINDRGLKNAITEANFKMKYEKVKGEIEKDIIEYFQKEKVKSLSTEEIESYMVTLLEQKDQKFQKIYKSEWSRLVFNVILHSKKINLTWGDCTLINEN